MGKKQLGAPLGPGDFRRLALALPEAEESQHMGHPDFRVRGKVCSRRWAIPTPNGGW